MGEVDPNRANYSVYANMLICLCRCTRLPTVDLHCLQAPSSSAFLGKQLVRPAVPHLQARRTPAVRATRAAVSPAVLVQANLFSRLFRVVRAYVSNFTEQFEDPEVMLDRVTEEMQEDLIKMRQATAKVGPSIECKS
jgi:hypothetical protein